MEVSGAGTLDALNPEAFMKLFIAQVKHQDPTDPLNPNQMMAQLAQLASVQQLSQLNETFQSAFRTEQLALAKDLIGSEVTYQADGGTQTGTVTEVAVERDVVGLMIEARFVPLGDVRGVLKAEG